MRALRAVQPPLISPCDAPFPLPLQPNELLTSVDFWRASGEAEANRTSCPSSCRTDDAEQKYRQVPRSSLCVVGSVPDQASQWFCCVPFRVRLIYARPSEEAAARADCDDARQLSAAWPALHAEIAMRTVPSEAVPAAADRTEDINDANDCAPEHVVARVESLQVASATSEGSPSWLEATLHLQ